MSWIEEVPYEAATGALKKIYERVKGPNNNVDNVLSVHSLRPHSLTGHMGLYKNVLHHAGNSLPKWYLETLGVYVSHLNVCSYCVDHHAQGLKRLLNNEERYTTVYESITTGEPSSQFAGRELAGIRYAHQLTLNHTSLQQSDIQTLRDAGFSDGEILEINQVVSYFNYVNRTVVGLGVNTEGDILGLSPNDNNDPDNWGHD